MKTAKLFWSLSSILINVTIGIYIYLQQKGPNNNLAERFEFVNENWIIYGGHWKAEFLLMTMMMVGAVYFMTHWKSISWTIISIGQLIILLTYPIMLGGYENTPFEVANMANQVATVTFVFGNVVFFAGLTHLYFNSTVFKPWLRYVSIALSAIVTLMFTLVFMGYVLWKDVLIMAPLVNVLYLINAYYVYKIPSEPQPVVS